MKFTDRMMTPAEKAVLMETIDKITDLEKSTVGVSNGIDELQSFLLLMVDTAIIVQEIDDVRFEENTE